MRQDDLEGIKLSFVGQEDGHIYFFYRPKILEASGPQDVSELYFILHPLDSKLFRLIRLDGSALPDEERGFNLITGTVLKVDSKSSVILRELEARSGEVLGVPQVKQSSARPCAEGVYTIIKREDHPHLVYDLELPRLDGKISRSLRINNEGNFEIGVYNPYYETPPQTGEIPKAAVWPESFKDRFGNKRIVYQSIPELLNFAHTKVALFRAPASEFRTEEEELHPLHKTEKTADIFIDLRIQKERYPVEPLVKGDWR
jgi:hypothetical protein